MILIGLCSTCNKAEILLTDPSEYNYYPIKKGYWITYTVDSVKISFNNPKIDSFVSNYQIKEVLDSSEIDLAGNERWKLSVYRRKDSTQPWAFVKLWSLFLRDNALHKIENNEDYVKLVFPLKKGAKWYDRVHYNTELERRISDTIHYEYAWVNAPYQLSNRSFDSTVRVIHYAYEDLINKDYSEEVYAKNIGMIYRELYQLAKNNTINPWTKPEEGFSIRYQYLDHAK